MCSYPNEFVLYSTHRTVKAMRTVWNIHLPLEIYHFDEFKSNPFTYDNNTKLRNIGTLLNKSTILNATAEDFKGVDTEGIKGGVYMCKQMALYFTRFDRLIYLDNDVIFFENPLLLFQQPEFLDHGSMFFQDQPTMMNCTQWHFDFMKGNRGQICDRPAPGGLDSCIFAFDRSKACCISIPCGSKTGSQILVKFISFLCQ